jgi:hypothetical protein
MWEVIDTIKPFVFSFLIMYPFFIGWGLFRNNEIQDEYKDHIGILEEKFEQEIWEENDLEIWEEEEIEKKPSSPIMTAKLYLEVESSLNNDMVEDGFLVSLIPEKNVYISEDQHELISLIENNIYKMNSNEECLISLLKELATSLKDLNLFDNVVIIYSSNFIDFEQFTKHIHLDFCELKDIKKCKY